MNTLQQAGMILQNIASTATKAKLEELPMLMEPWPESLLLCLSSYDLRIHRRAGGVLYLDYPEGNQMQIWNHKELRRLPEAQFLVVTHPDWNFQKLADSIIAHRLWAAAELRNLLNQPQPYDPFSL